MDSSPRSEVGKLVVGAVVLVGVFGVAAWSLRPMFAPVKATTSVVQQSWDQRRPPDIGLGARGRITAVSESSITLQSRDGVTRTFAVPSSARVRLDGTDSKLTALKVGHFARVSSDDGKTATSVSSRTHFRRPGGYGGDGRFGGGGPGGGGFGGNGSAGGGWPGAGQPPANLPGVGGGSL